MTNTTKYLIYIKLFLGLYAVCGAQSFEDSMVEVTPKWTRLLGIENDLPTICYSDIITDDQGRFWMAPCGDDQIRRRLHLVQFNGHKGQIFDLNLPDQGRIILGKVEGNCLMGLDIHNTSLFYFNIHTQEVRFVKANFPGYQFYDMHFHEDKIFIMAAAEKSRAIIEYGVDGFRKIYEAEVSAVFNPVSAFQMRDFSLKKGSEIWFVNDDSEIVSFDVTSQLEKTYTIPIKFSLTEASVINWGGRIVIASRKDLGLWEIVGNTVKALDVLPQGWSYRLEEIGTNFFNIAYSDDAGWLMVQAKDVFGRQRWILIHAADNRRVLDYTPVIESLEEQPFVYAESKDFTQSFLSYMGLVQIVEIQKDFGIDSKRTLSTRSMGMLNEDTLLWFTTHVERYLLDIRNTGTAMASSADHILSEVPNEPVKIEKDNQGNLWYINDQGIEKLDVRTRKRTVYPIGQSIEMFELIGTDLYILLGGDLHVLNINNGSISKVSHTLSDPDAMIKGFVNAMEGEADAIWIGTNYGLWRFDRHSSKLERIQLIKKEAVPVLCIMPDSSGSVFLGTDVHGLIEFNYKKSSAQVYVEGFPNLTVVGLLTDADGHIWCSTFNGVAVFDRQYGVIATFTSDEGLMNNEANRWSHLKLPDNRLAFGSIQGISIIDPQKALESYRNNIRSNIYVSKIVHPESANDRYTTMFNPALTDVLIKMPARNRNIEVELGISNYSASVQNEYFYKIDLPGYPWVTARDQSKITITNLPSGRYNISFRAKDASDLWTTNTVALPIHVLLPWHRTKMAYAIYLTGLGLIFWIINRVQRNRLALKHQLALEQTEAERLKDVNEFRSKFYTNITHEFRTPLTIILGITKQLRKWNRSDDENRKLDLIKRNSDSLLNLVNHMLDLSKIEHDVLDTDMKHAEILSYLKYLMESYTTVANEHNILLKFDSPQAQIWMDYDADKIQQIFSNLVSNAIKFSNTGSIVHIFVEESAGEMILSVNDAGPGIPKAEIDQIFERYYQTGDKTEQRLGTGIGLALTKELVQLLNGKIHVESVIGTGSTFTIILPIHKKAKIETADRSLPKETSLKSNFTSDDVLLPDFEKPRLLVIEDNLDLVEYLTDCLKPKYQLEFAYNGAIGIDKAFASMPEMIISDVMMPQKTGYEVAETLKNDERTSHIPIIMLTAKADYQSRLDGLQRGADVYLAKPFQQEELLAHLHNLRTTRVNLQKKYQEAALSDSQDEYQHLEIQERHFLKKLKAFIELEMDNADLRPPEIAKGVGMSRSSLYAKMSAVTGMTISNYVRMLRLQKAKELLTSTTMSVSEIAYSVGYKDPNYFSRQFKKQFGSIPRELRV